MSIVNTKSNGPSSRWYVLALAAITFAFTIAMQQICMTVLFKEISGDLGLSLVEMGVVWGIPALAGLFSVFIGGLLSDRYGARRIMGIAFWVIPGSVFKTNAAWFSGRPLVIANSVVSAGMGLGFTVGSLISATVLSPLLGGWQNVMFLYGGISVVIGFLWFFTVREFARPGSASSVGGVPLLQSISRVFPTKSLWFIGLTLLGYAACIQGMVGYLPTYLRNIGWTAASADGTLAVFTAISTLGTIPLALLADRIGLKKAVLFPVLVVTVVGMVLLPLVDNGMVYAIMILIGIGRDGFMAICLTMSTETKGIGVVYAATAMGLAQTVLNVGSLISPPLGNSLADPANPASPFPFFLWAAFGLLGLVAFIFVKETGWKRKELSRQ